MPASARRPCGDNRLRETAASAALVAAGCVGAHSDDKPAAPVEKVDVLTYKVKTITGEEVSLEKYKGKVVLFVNVATKCGLTPQYAGLQKLHEKYKDKGLALLGFPANNFLGQEPGSDAEIAIFCKGTYNVSFDMFSKISVKGNDQAPLYKTLTAGAGDPKLAGDVDWNFAKFLVGRDGKLAARFSARTKPDDEKLVASIEAELGKK